MKTIPKDSPSGLDLVFPMSIGWGEWDDFTPANEAQGFAYRVLSTWLTHPDNPTWFPDDFQEGMAMLIGPPGVGKTYLAHRLFSKVRRMYCADAGEWPAIWVSAPSLMNWLPRAGDYWDFQSSLLGADLFEDLSPFAKMVVSQWLFIDDLREPRDKAERDFIVNLFDARTDQQPINTLSGVITTNLDPDTLKRAYGERTFDRLNAGALWIPMLGNSLRRPQALRLERESEVNL